MPTCARDRNAACESRYAAIRSGLCWYSWAGRGWFVIRSGIPTTYEHCPWCGGVLPVLTDVILRAIAERETDGD